MEGEKKKEMNENKAGGKAIPHLDLHHTAGGRGSPGAGWLRVAGMPVPGGGPGAVPDPGGPKRFPSVPMCSSRRAPRGTPEVPPRVAMGTGGRGGRRPEELWKP